MCPACIGVMTWAALGAGSAGIVGAIGAVVRRVVPTGDSDAPMETRQAEPPMPDDPAAPMSVTTAESSA